MKYKQVPISVIIGALVVIFIINITRIYDKEKNIENEENVTNNEYLPGKKAAIENLVNELETEINDLEITTKVQQ